MKDYEKRFFMFFVYKVTKYYIEYINQEKTNNQSKQKKNWNKKKKKNAYSALVLNAIY